jgi:hypothetical protein
VREALGRYFNQLNDDRRRDEIRDLLYYFAAEDQSAFVVVWVEFESAVVNRQADEIRDALQTGETEKLAKESFLEVGGNQRVQLQEYRLWGRQSGLFKFSRSLEVKPLITPTGTGLRFQTKLGKTSVVTNFKPKEMLYQGALEY